MIWVFVFDMSFETLGGICLRALETIEGIIRTTWTDFAVVDFVSSWDCVDSQYIKSKLKKGRLTSFSWWLDVCHCVRTRGNEVCRYFKTLKLAQGRSVEGSWYLVSLVLLNTVGEKSGSDRRKKIFVW